ncbi:hypothetical protein HA466_0282500 [Hirschfeldia incana]|nr:hypothetical protein HA466_0282500 [Hirschfeldia incana]
MLLISLRDDGSPTYKKFVAGLSFSSTGEALTLEFSQYGRVLGVGRRADCDPCHNKSCKTESSLAYQRLQRNPSSICGRCSLSRIHRDGCTLERNRGG